MTSKKELRECYERELQVREQELVKAYREVDTLKAENERLRADLSAHMDKQARTWTMLPPQAWRPMPYGPYWSILPQQAGFPE